MISIVTINKNNLEGLRRTANSVLNQNDKNFNWLILDGQSYDGSIEYIRSLEFDMLEAIIEEDEGIYHAMNKAIDLINPNDLVWFLNSGDALYDYTVVSEINKRNFNGEIVYGDYVLANFESNFPKLTKVISPDELNVLWLVKKTLNHQSYLVRGSLLKLHPFNLEYKVCADWVQFFSIIWSTPELRIEKIKKPLISYETGGFSFKQETVRLIERKNFLESMFSEKVLCDLNTVSSLVSKEEYPLLKKIAKGKYRWIILKVYY